MRFILPKSKQRRRLYRYWKLLLCFLFFTIVFLFYPGDSYYIRLFSYNRDLFATSQNEPDYVSKPVPYLKNPFFTPTISAEGVYIIDLASATPVYEKNSHGRFLPASTAKIITALVAFDQFGLNDTLEVKRASPEGQVVGVVLGERLNFENVLYGLLIHSGNDMAYLLADNYPGGEKKFVAVMNQKAEELGMANTVFKNPAGLDQTGQYSTPLDLSLAGRRLLENETLSRIVSTKSITISDVDFKYFHHLSNVNKLLGEIAGIGGLKTGYTEEAGENLVTFYKKNGHQFLIVILKSADRFADTKQIVTWIDDNVTFINP